MKKLNLIHTRKDNLVPIIELAKKSHFIVMMKRNLKQDMAKNYILQQVKIKIVRKWLLRNLEMIYKVVVSMLGQWINMMHC